MRNTANAFNSRRYQSAGQGAGGSPALKTDSVPAPIGGWDTLSPIAMMDPDHAVALDNWIPRPGYIEIRRGSTVFANTNNVSSPVETLMAFNAPNIANSKLFAAAGSVIYDVTHGGGASPGFSNGFSIGFGGPFAQQVTGLTSARWQYVNFTAAAGTHYLIAVNGSDQERIYNGSSWANLSSTVTGYTAGTLIQIQAHQQRLWFIPENSTLVYYLAVGAISGAVTGFELGQLMTLGGFVMAAATWSVDTRQTVDDYLAFITSRGQVIVYMGIDPSSSTTWSLVGVYNVGTPIGRRCFLKVAGDIFIMTLDGILPMSQMLSTDRTAANRVSLTAMIMDTFRQSTTLYSANFGWQFIGYPKGQIAIANIPTATDGSSLQYVMNTLTGAWCRFVGMTAICWEVFNDVPYFGSTGGLVYQFDVDSGDGSNAIVATAQTAFNYFNDRGQRKRYTMVRPLITTDHNVVPGVGINVDYSTTGSVSNPVFEGFAGSIWDSAVWDTATWPGESAVTTSWQSLEGEGFCASFIVQATTTKTGLSNGVLLRLNGFDVAMEPGGNL